MGEERLRAVNIDVLTERFKGQMVVSASTETWEKAERNYEWAVTIKLSTGRDINVVGLASAMKKAWVVNNGVTFEEVASNMVIARFDDKEKLEKALEGGPWTYSDCAVIIRRWDGNIKLDNLNFDKVQLWMQIHNLPLGFIEDEFARGFAELAGTIYKRPVAEAGVLRKRFVRYKIEIDVNQPVVPGVYFKDKNGELLWIAFKYERLPQFCEFCGCLSHESGSCNSEAAVNGIKKFDATLRASGSSGSITSADNGSSISVDVRRGSRGRLDSNDGRAMERQHDSGAGTAEVEQGYGGENDASLQRTLISQPTNYSIPRQVGCPREELGSRGDNCTVRVTTPRMRNDVVNESWSKGKGVQQDMDSAIGPRRNEGLCVSQEHVALPKPDVEQAQGLLMMGPMAIEMGHSNSHKSAMRRLSKKIV
ncbi:hypothetical protein QQ045_001213 [Rhodiola kirilowii]